MRKSVFIFCIAAVLFYGCNDKVTETVTYMANEPVFMSAKSFVESVVVTPDPVPVSNYGKMCFYEGHIYISKPGEGIHIIDNSDPADPQNIGFIEIIGNADIAIRNDMLYADALIDLLWFDISNPGIPSLKGRLEGVFPNVLPVIDNGYSYIHSECVNIDRESQGIIIGWNLKQYSETYIRENSGWMGGWYDQTEYDAISNSGKLNSGSRSSNGINGSMSRFALYSDYLYTVINNFMSIIDLSGDKPVKAAENIYIGNSVETIFNYEDNMFMGTPTGMMIYSVADPLKPERLSTVWHVTGCDPVVVEDDIAYVTVHSGNACGQNNNDLIIYDVSDVRSPKHIVTYAMKNPKGLGIDNGTLFLCDDGLKIYNASDPQTIMANLLAHYTGMDGFDVIPSGNILMMIADDGLYQYDYTDLNSIKQLSRLPIVKK